MKAKFYLIAAAACAALAACSKNEVAPVDVDQEITFQAVVNKASTKALISSTSYATTNTFGSVAYMEDQVYISSSEVSFNSIKNYWSTETAYYWPVSKKLNFMSWSPYKYQESTYKDDVVSVSHEKDKLTLSGYNVQAHQETDLMVAEIKKDQTANTDKTASGTWVKGVPTIFHHKLSQVVKFTFQTVNSQNTSEVVDYAHGHTGEDAEGKRYMAGDQQFFINKVSFKNLNFSGDYTYDATDVDVSEGWTNPDNSVSETVWFNEANENSDGKFIAGSIVPGKTNDDGSHASLNYILVLPQSFSATSGHALYVKYTVRTYYADNKLSTDVGCFSDEVIETTIPLYEIHNASDHKWDMNKKITYTISLTKQRIYWDPSVVNWGDESLSVQI